MNVGYVHTFEVPENNIDKGRLKVSVVNEENVPIKGAAVRLSYTGNPDNIIGESGTDGDGISIFNDLRTPPIEYSMEPGNRQYGARSGMVRMTTSCSRGRVILMALPLSGGDGHSWGGIARRGLEHDL